MSDIDDLENMMAVAGDSPAAKEESPASEVVPAVVPEGPRLSMRDGASAREVALQGLSPALREMVIADAAAMGIRIEYDLSWLLLGSQVRSWAAAQASGAAAAAADASAREVAAGVADIPKTILKGAMQATKSVQDDIRYVLDQGGLAILKSIDVAAQAGSDKIKAGSADLIEKLDQAVEAKKKEGVSAFALAAGEAAVAAAGAASARVISESKVKLRYSLLAMSLIFLVYTGLGVFIGYEYLNLTDRIAPHALVVKADGKANCGTIPAPGGGDERVCQVR